MPKNPYVLLACIVALVALLWGAYEKGQKDCKTAYELAQANAAKDSRIVNEGIDRGYDLASKEIRKIPSNGCIGTVTGGAVDWLRAHYR